MIICLAAESLRISGILLQPFIPGKAGLLLDMLGVQADRRDFPRARLGMDDSYGVSNVDVGQGTVGVLFPPLVAED
jgi:methionyl-tRNA synthetase